MLKFVSCIIIVMSFYFVISQLIALRVISSKESVYHSVRL